MKNAVTLNKILSLQNTTDNLKPGGESEKIVYSGN